MDPYRSYKNFKPYFYYHLAFFPTYGKTGVIWPHSFQHKWKQCIRRPTGFHDGIESIFIDLGWPDFETLEYVKPILVNFKTNLVTLCLYAEGNVGWLNSLKFSNLQQQLPVTRVTKIRRNKALISTDYDQTSADFLQSIRSGYPRFLRQSFPTRWTSRCGLIGWKVRPSSSRSNEQPKIYHIIKGWRSFASKLNFQRRLRCQRTLVLTNDNGTVENKFRFITP